MRKSETISSTGSVAMQWHELAKVRAEVVSASGEETSEAFGDADGGPIVCRIRWRDDVRLKDRVLVHCAVYEIEELAEIGRKRGLEIKANLIIPAEESPYLHDLPPVPEEPDDDCVVWASTNW